MTTAETATTIDGMTPVAGTDRGSGRAMRGRAGRPAHEATAVRGLEEVRLGRPAIVAVFGEPGIGKTRLLTQMVDEARQHGCALVHAAGALSIVDQPHALLADLCQTASPPRDAAALAARLLRRAGGRPLVVAIDDLQWADPASRHVLTDLIRNWPDGPILGLLASRSGPSSALLERAIDEAGPAPKVVAHVTLGPLDEADAIAALGARVPAAAQNDVLRWSGRNPELLDALADAATTEQSSAVPERIVRSVGQELSALSPAARALALGGAVLGEPFALDVAAAVGGIGAGRCHAASSALLDEGVIRPARASGPASGRWAFRHPIIGPAVYASAPPGSRLAAHARAAAELTHRGAPAEALAPHLERALAHEDGAGSATLATAAHAAVEREPATAARWFAGALRLLPFDADPTVRSALLAARAHALAAAGAFDEARTVIDSVVLDGDDAEAWAATVLAAARLHRVAGDRPYVSSLCASARERRLPPALKRSVLVAGAVEAQFTQDWDVMHASADTALQARTPDEDPIGAAGALALRSSAAIERGATAASMRDLAAAAALLAPRAQRRDAGAWIASLVFLAEAELRHGLHRAAIEHAERAAELAESTNHDLTGPALLPLLAEARLLNGQLTEAAALARRAAEDARRVGGTRVTVAALAAQCAIAAHRGDFAGAIAAGRNAVALAGSAASSLLEARAHAALGLALVGSGAFAEGQAHLVSHCGGRSMARLPATARPDVVAALVHGALGAGRFQEAQTWLAHLRVSTAAMDLAHATAAGDCAGAAVLLADGKPEAGLLAGRAANAYATLGRPLHAAQAQALAGRAAMDTTTAAAHVGLHRLEAAHRTFEACGALRDRDRVAWELRALGRRVGRTGYRSLDGVHGIALLSPREREIAQRVAQGHTNRQIAEALFLTPKTVETHLSNMFEKLGVTSRVKIAALWVAERADVVAAPTAA